MTQHPIFIGDRLSAAGFRLGGTLARVPEPGTEQAAFSQALEETDLVLVTAEVASRLPEPLLSKALSDTSPLVLVIPDVRGLQEPPDISINLRRQLGMIE